MSEPTEPELGGVRLSACYRWVSLTAQEVTCSGYIGAGGSSIPGGLGSGLGEVQPLHPPRVEGHPGKQNLSCTAPPPRDQEPPEDATTFCILFRNP